MENRRLQIKLALVSALPFIVAAQITRTRLFLDTTLDLSVGAVAAICIVTALYGIAWINALRSSVLSFQSVTIAVALTGGVAYALVLSAEIIAPYLDGASSEKDGVILTVRGGMAFEDCSVVIQLYVDTTRGHSVCFVHGKGERRERAAFVPKPYQRVIVTTKETVLGDVVTGIAPDSRFVR